MEFKDFLNKVKTIIESLKIGDIVILGRKGDNYTINNNFNVPENCFLIQMSDGSLACTKTETLQALLSAPKIKQIAKDYSISVEEAIRAIKEPPNDELLEKMLPFLREDIKIILRLSNLAKVKYDAGKRQEGDNIKDDIGLHYGKGGRKLCNLYTRGYITSQEIKEYVGSVLTLENAEEKQKRLNKVIDTIIEFTEFVFFISKMTKEKEIIRRIFVAMKQKKGYIALHSVGEKNKKKSYKIYGEVSKKIKEYNYKDKSETTPTSDTKYPICDIIFTPA